MHRVDCWRKKPKPPRRLLEVAEEDEEEAGKGQERGGLGEGGRFGRKGFIEETEEGGRGEDGQKVMSGGGGVSIGGGGVVSGGVEPAAGVWRINSQVNGTGAHLEANIHFNIVK